MLNRDFPNKADGMETPRVALYLRVSTRDQSPESQQNELRSYCERRGWSKVSEYAEKESGANASRTMLDKMLTDARAGKFKILVVYKIDRLGRSLAHLLQVLQELAGLGIGVVAPGQGIDTTENNPVGKLQMHILGAVAEFEGDLISERSRAGQANARKKGQFIGRPPKHAKEIERAKKLRAKGWTFRAIAKATKLSPGYLCEILPKKKK